MFLASKPPHDFTLTLDVTDYFEEEYDVEEIYEGGFARPLRLSERDVLVVATFNEDPDAPGFTLSLPEQDAPSTEEQAEIMRGMGRVLGSELDYDAFLEAVSDDPVLGPIAHRHVGFKRLSRADFYEDTIRLVIRTRIAHEKTKRKMVRAVREAYGTTFQWRGRSYFAYPRPEVLAEVDPADLRDHGLSKRKGEYITGLAKMVVDGELDLAEIELADPQTFHDLALTIRGVGPSSAQFLMLRRNRSDAAFMTRDDPGASGLLRWFLPRYGIDPKEADPEAVDAVLSRWEGFEAMVSHTLYYDHVIADLEKAHQAALDAQAT